ncbi:MAG: prepilin-type N-terminal cleavage/methylation domain-containing protein [Polyangiaceae bacterium]
MNTRARKRGYTAVELMMAISIFGIGVAGIISMEKVTSVSNQHAKNLGIASHIAESWLDMLSTDAVMWNHPATGDPTPSDLGQTAWLQSVGANQDAAANWTFPAESTALDFGPGFDALGNHVNLTLNPGSAAFCSNIRLSWLYQPTQNGNGLIRAEVRVFWLRNGQTFTGDMCSAAALPRINGAATTFHFVQKITAIRESNR